MKHHSLNGCFPRATWSHEENAGEGGYSRIVKVDTSVGVIPLVTGVASDIGGGGEEVVASGGGSVEAAAAEVHIIIVSVVGGVLVVVGEADVVGA